MAQFGAEDQQRGQLQVGATPDSDGFVHVTFVPVDSPATRGAAAARAAHGVRILSYSPGVGQLHIYPINTLPDHENFLGPKYSKVQLIMVDLPGFGETPWELDVHEMLDLLPAGFIKNYNYGLGVLRDIKRLIHLIEEHTDCDTIRVSEDVETGALGNIFNLQLDDFEAIWSEVGRITSRGNTATARVKDAAVHNALASALNVEMVEFTLGRHPVVRAIAKAAANESELSDAEKASLLAAVSADSKALAEAAPEGFARLHREIELVNLQGLIASYEQMLTKNLPERKWQEFFDINAFALQQVFGAPMVTVAPHAATGGLTLSGAGTKIADFLVKNSLTNNLALVEIKKPSTPLLRSAEYRPGVYGVSNELNEAVTQVLDQAHHLKQEFLNLSHNSRLTDIESYAVGCFVVAGTAPSTLEPNRVKSFELYRANSRAVTIVTYDEILARLRLLHDFLSPGTEVDA